MPLASTLGFGPLLPLYWLFLGIMLLAYALLTQVVKTWFIRNSANDGGDEPNALFEQEATAEHRGLSTADRSE